MRNILFALAMMTLGACAQSVLHPSGLKAFSPLHHNIPASFINQSDKIIWLCATQPRNYEGKWEEDHYLQREQCPILPIQ